MTAKMQIVLAKMADGFKLEMSATTNGIGMVGHYPVRRSTFNALRSREWIRYTTEGYEITKEGLAAVIGVEDKRA
jgi:hypothetical protein